MTKDIKKASAHFRSGNSLLITVNQGSRFAQVLGTIDNMMIVEYTMPAGTTALQIMHNDEDGAFGRSVSYKSCPKKWIQAIRDGSGGWKGICQRNGLINFPDKLNMKGDDK